MASKRNGLAKLALSLLLVLGSPLGCAGGFRVPGRPELLSPDQTPFQLSILPPAQLFSPATAVRGLRVSVVGGDSPSVTGLDLGGLFATTSGAVRGVQLSGFANRADGSVTGLQLAAITNLAGRTTGAMVSFANQGSTHGLQLGFGNSAPKMRGLQLGVFNVSEELHGLQLGLLNVSPNGFLPIFPLLNFHLPKRAQEEP